MTADGGPGERDRWARTKALFADLLALPPAERDAWLAMRAEIDAEEAQELESLLQAHEADEAFLERPPVTTSGTMYGPDTRIGPYRLIRELGRGGMGLVFLAERVDGEFDQKVAIKLARLGISSEYSRRRFGSERQILAGLTHPNVAQLFDGGVTEDGWPYLVMERVEGTPITTYCREAALDVRARIELLETVCEAVEFAHRNLVVHRDLKPSNILVTEDGHVKLLDFGVAKLLAPSDEEEDGLTQTDVALTPEYAAPERFLGRSVTTLADVYGLGVLAYEMLTGTRPFDLKGFGLAEAQRRILEVRPETPSRVVSRRAPVGVPRLDPDVDRILLKALRKTPEARYASARAFGEDLRRYLEGRPVRARTPTVRYRVGRFVRRNRVGVAAVATGALAATAGIAGVVWQARVAFDRAEEARVERDRAQEAAATANRINEFLQGVLLTANPAWWVESEQKGPDVTVLAALEEAARRMEVDLAEDPGVRADIHHTLGETYTWIPDNEAALRHFEAAVELRREVYQGAHYKTAESLFYLGVITRRLGDNPAGAALSAAAVEMAREGGRGEAYPYLVADLAGIHRVRGEFRESAALYDEVLESAPTILGPGHLSIGAFSVARAGIALSLGATEEAARFLDRAGYEPYDLADPRPGLESYLLARALLAGQEGDLSRARAYWDEAAFDAGSYQILNFIEGVLLPHGEATEAIALAETFVEAIRARPPQGWEDPQVARAWGVMSRAWAMLGEEDRARDLAQQALEMIENEGAQNQPYYWFETQAAELGLGRSLVLQGHYSEAEQVLLAHYQKGLDRGLSGQASVPVLAELVHLYEAWGRAADGIRYRAALDEQLLASGRTAG